MGLASKLCRHERRVMEMGGDVAAVTPMLRPCHIPHTRHPITRWEQVEREGGLIWW